jgi:hypothetical protein
VDHSRLSWLTVSSLSELGHHHAHAWMALGRQRADSRLPLHADRFISHKVLLKSCCKSQFPHKSVNLFFILVIVKDMLTILWGG